MYSTIVTHLVKTKIIEDLFLKESKVCIQLSLSIHQESRDETRQNPQIELRKITFLNGMKKFHNKGPKQLGQKE